MNSMLPKVRIIILVLLVVLVSANAFSQTPSNYYTFDFNCGSLRCLTDYINQINPSGNPYINLITLGNSAPPDPKPIYAFEISDFAIPEDQKRHVFIIGRLHGAEYAQSYVLEGLIDYLLSGSGDPVVNELLSSVHLTVVPIANPYGANSFLIKNQAGVNLQADWHPSWNHAGEQPETQAVHGQIDKIIHDFGLDLILNIHDPYSPPVGAGTPTPLATPIDGDYGYRGPSYYPSPFYRPDQFNRLSVFTKVLNTEDSFHSTTEWDRRILNKKLLDYPPLVGGCDRCLYQQHRVEIATIEYASNRRTDGTPVTIPALKNQGEGLARAIHNYLFTVQHWVSESGSNSNDGSKEFPWRTVSYALNQITTASSAVPHIVNVDSGTYSGNVLMKSHVYLQGSGIDQSILQASSGNVIDFSSVENSLVDGFTI